MISKIQFLLIFISIIPLISSAIIYATRNQVTISKFSSIAIPALFLVNVVVVIFTYLEEGSDSILFLKMNRDIFIGFNLEPISLIFLSLLCVIWINISIYSVRYFRIRSDLSEAKFQFFLTLIIWLVTMILFSKNLLSMFLFYQALIFCLYFFNTHFVDEKNLSSSNNIVFFLLISSFILLLAIILSYKIFGHVEFQEGGIVNDNISSSLYILVLSLYFIGILSVITIPLYLFYGKIYYLNSPIIIIIFIISSSLVSLFILLKVINNIFGVEIFSSYNSQIGADSIISLSLSVNLLACAILALVSKNLRKILIYLFFNQLIMTVIAIFVFAESIQFSIISILSFVLGQILIFLSVGNINLYLVKSKNSSMDGVFYKMKSTVFLLTLGLFNILGLSPMVGMIDKYFLINHVIQNQNMNFVTILAANLMLNLTCILKILYPMFKVGTAKTKSDLTMAKLINSDLRLIIPPSVIVLVMFFIFIFPTPITQFVK